MSYSWYRKGTCTVDSSNTVRFQNAGITTAPNKPVVGDAFIVNGGKLYEIIFIGSDSSGEFVRLNKAYAESPASNVDYAIARFASGTQNAKLVAMASAAINQKQISLDDFYEWYTTAADTVDFSSPDGTTVTLSSYAKLTKEISTVGSNTGDIVKVAAAIDDVKAVGSNITEVKAVGADMAAITQVNTNMPAIVELNKDIDTIKSVNANMPAIKDAKPQADRAKAEADRAKAAADSIEKDTVLLSEPQSQAIRRANKEKYTASGCLHLGKAYRAVGYTPINEGMFTAEATPNELRIGRGVGGIGSSKTEYAVTHIAGTISKLLSVNSDTNLAYVKMLLPPAPNGAVTADSATGVITDFTKDIDPKYNNVATNIAEALARSFEGHVKNGDFRFGDNGDWVPNDSTITVSTDGVDYNGSSVGKKASAYGIRTIPNTLYVIEFTVSNWVSGGLDIKTTGGEAVRSGTGNGRHRIEIKPDLNTARPFWEFRATSGATLRISNVSIRPKTNEVVINRHDFLALEYWPEEVIDDEVFPVNIQNLSLTFGDTDVPTVPSARPDSYFASYDGQTNIIKGRCVKWSTLSDENKLKVSVSLGENLFKGVNGKPVNWRSRYLSIAGAGNGNWEFIDSSGTVAGAEFLSFKKYQGFVQAQGSRDTPVQGKRIDSNTSNTFRSTGGGGNNYPEVGVYTIRDIAGMHSYNGECYLLTLGTVQRLNQGASHDVYNPLGTKKFRQAAGSVNSHAFWYESLAYKPTTRAECFTEATANLNGNGAIGGGSGRQDQYKYHDAIYAGLVQDKRMTVQKQSKAEALTEYVRRSVRGETRGNGSVPFTKFYKADQSATSSNTTAFDNILPVGSSVSVGEVCSLENAAGVYETVTVVNLFGSGNRSITFTPSISGRKADSKGMFTEYMDSKTQFDSLPWVDIVGDPERIAATFPDGVVGQWIPVIPNGGIDSFPANRKINSPASGSLNRVYTDNDGGSWTKGSATSYNAVTNELTLSNSPSNRVLLCFYEALSNFTESDNSRAVVGDLGDVPVTGSYTVDNGNRFMPSVIGEIGKMANRYPSRGEWALTFKGALDDGELLTRAEYAPQHVELGLDRTANKSHAVKSMPKLVDKNGQLFVQWHSTELVYDTGAANWGDDKNIHIINGESTLVDLNKVAVKVSTHTELNPIGWNYSDK